MVWSGKGKHEGWDINDVPDSYLKYMVAKSTNPNSVQMAEQAITYRATQGISVPDPPRSGQGQPVSRGNVAAPTPIAPVQSPQVQGQSSRAFSLRAKVLELAILMDAQRSGDPNPWPYIKPVHDYMSTGQLPNLSSMLTDAPPTTSVTLETAPNQATSVPPSVQKGDPFLSELDDDALEKDPPF